MDPESSLYIMSVLAVPWNLFFNKRSGVVGMSPDSDGLGAAPLAGVGSNLTQPSGISYFSQYMYIYIYTNKQQTTNYHNVPKGK